MKTRSILTNKAYLYITEFFSGMAVMAVELGANRLLAPYFSSSQIVWTIIIGTIMIAMALGNIYGGRSADKNADPARLYKRIIIAALWIAAIPLAGKYVILLISGVLILSINTGFLIWAAFASCMIVFVFPCFLLGTVTPSLVKYTVSSLDNNGRIVGQLGAFNTIGSILGTFLPTFVTIPAVGTSITFLIFSGVLLALGLIFFISEKRKLIFCAIALVIFVLCSIFGRSDSFAFWEKSLAYEGESIYNYLQVKDTESSVILSTNVLFGVQSIYMKNEGLTGMYYDYAMAAPVMAGFVQEKTGALKEGTKKSALILGNGTGTFAKMCLKYFPDTYVEGVEIDGKITKLAAEYFEMPESVKVTTYDGRAYLEGNDSTYDLIMVDAYRDITVPFQMSSREFFFMVKDHMTKNGVMVMNVNMWDDKEGSINDYLTDTVASVFDYVYIADVDNSTNREVYAFNDPSVLKTFEKGTENLDDGELKTFMEENHNSFKRYTGGNYILTDDKAPVELLGMDVIDTIIQEEIGYYKQIFKEQGLTGLLNS